MYRRSKRKNKNNRRAIPLCYVCLSSDRTLTSLNKLEKVFQQIIDGLDLEMVPTSLFCWECIALLKRVNWFKERAKKSQILLRDMKNSELTLPSLSNLKVVKLTSTYSRITVPVETSFDDEIKTEIDDLDDPLQVETEIGLNRSEYDLYDDHINDDHTNVDHIKDDHINVDHIKDDHIKDDHINDDHIKDDNINDGRIHDDETKTNEALHVNNLENVNNLDSLELRSEYDDDFEYQEEIEQFNDLDSSESKTVNKDEDLKNTKSENKKAKKEKVKRKQEDSDSDYELPEKMKLAIERELNIGTDNQDREREGIYTKANYEMTRTYSLSRNFKSWVPIETREELILMREKERNSLFFKSLEKKCDLCLTNVDGKHDKFHQKRKTKTYSCDICNIYMDDEEKMKIHIQKHYFKHQCNVCGYDTISYRNMNQHLRSKHSRIVQCRHCEAKFENKWVFNEHFREMHAKFQCNYCNKIFRLKKNLNRHIFSYHTPHKCESCPAVYSEYRRYKAHVSLKHVVEKSEATYCVTCDIHFDNSKLYKLHCVNAAIHKKEIGIRKTKERIKCEESECSKTFLTKYNMIRHHRFVHLKQSEYICTICDMQFLKKERLDYHRKVKHEGYQRERNKICQYCGRGFTVRTFELK